MVCLQRSHSLLSLLPPLSVFGHFPLTTVSPCGRGRLQDGRHMGSSWAPRWSYELSPDMKAIVYVPP